MFISRLFRHSKIAAICFVSVIVAFLYINYKWGVVASPLYQLGMFSRPVHTSDTLIVYTIHVDDKPLLLNELPFVHNDMLLVSLSRLEDHREHNLNVMGVFNKFSLKMLKKPLSHETFTNKITDAQATDWFKNLLKSYQVQVSKLSVTSNRYVWINQQLTAIGSPEIKNFIVNN